jgi:hypothetical protein
VSIASIALSIPAGIRGLTGLVFGHCEVKAVTADAFSRFFRISGDFLVDFEEASLVRHLGTDRDLVISSGIEIIARQCFSRCRGLSSVRFESERKALIRGVSAFANCSSLPSICRPSSIRIVSNSCFANCVHLSHLAFEPVHLGWVCIARL